ncbi:Pkinase-domain-containing protein [Backusella circina FSU 941]|nr:Pkinase-domain-containing protein [Backusella circina FSU 941]
MQHPEIIESLSAKTIETKEGLKKIDHYLLKQELGRGSFGIVHRGIDTHSFKEYAIKEFSKSRLKRKEQLQKLSKRRNGLLSTNSIDLIRSELAILKKLSHPNVIRLYQVLDDPDFDSIYMVLEMMKKGPLMDMENPTAFSEEEARYYFRQIILGIEYLHFNDVVHRDIKPDNMLLSENNKLKLADFGVSEIFEGSNDSMYSTAGTPAFMAPELCVARPVAVSGKAADIWSMGVTLYYLVFGKLPFYDRSEFTIYQLIREQPVHYEPCSKELLDLFHLILEKDPLKRITMSQLREHPWVTKNNKYPLTPQSENCSDQVSEVTEHDIRHAITRIRGLITVVR